MSKLLLAQAIHLNHGVILQAPPSGYYVISQILFTACGRQWQPQDVKTSFTPKVVDGQRTLKLNVSVFNAQPKGRMKRCFEVCLIR